MKKKNLSDPFTPSWFPALPLDLGVLQPTLRSPGKERSAGRKQGQQKPLPVKPEQPGKSSRAAAARIQIDARQEGNRINLEWKPASGYAPGQLLIERSGDGIAFHEIGRLPMQEAPGNDPYHRYSDRRPLAGINYYRLRLAGPGAAIQNLGATAIAFEGIASEACHLHLRQQPVTDELRVSWDIPAHPESLLCVFNLRGQLLLEHRPKEGSTATSLSMENLTAGTYVLHLNQQQQHDSIRFRKI